MALEALATPRPDREVLLETAPSWPSAVNRTEDSEVVVARFRRNRYALTLEAPRPGLVYSFESDFPGWTTRANGKPAATRRANYAFRAGRGGRRHRRHRARL